MFIPWLWKTSAAFLASSTLFTSIPVKSSASVSLGVIISIFFNKDSGKFWAGAGFKITLTPLLDRADYITYNDYKILIERREKVCNEHLKKNLMRLFQLKYLFEFLYINHYQFLYLILLLL